MEDDPIVICGMGCRLPGDVKSPSEFWDLIVSGRSAQSDVPANRFDIDRWYHPDPKRRGGIVARGGYFLSHDDSYRNFDPSFFGIHPLEAASMDPQQRKLLEVVNETFESAGVTLDGVSGSLTACYVGAFTSDFAKTLQREPERYWPYESTGTDMTTLSNRVNYVFNLKGPSFTVDTACSSSLYALRLAIQGLRLDEFDAAIVAGTNIIMDVGHQMTATKLGILSPTSTCHTFDASADGFGRAEGITVLYIKRLSDAVANGDPIRAVIRGSAINTNGKGIGISHPGREGQEAVIRQAYVGAKLDFHQTAYLECHGTGTPVGDPIEVAAAGEVFAEGRSAENPILLSSVKSQIGHTEGASGIAAIEKVVMALENGVVPATIGIKKLNPALDLKDGRLKIVQQSMTWPEGYRRASVNGFGYGGSNAHVIIDSADSYFQAKALLLPRTWSSKSRHRTPDRCRRQVLVSSGHTLESLRQNIASLSHTITQYQLADLAYTLSQRRTHFHHRAYAIATTQIDLEELSERWIVGAQHPKPPRVGFVFTGQGAQWPQMGLQLVERFHVFKEAFQGLQEHLDAVAERPTWTLFEALAASPEQSLMMTDVTVTVTLCTAIQICLVNLLKSWGVHPQAVVGHSSGEAAAAYCAGNLTTAEAIVTSYYRALALKKNPNLGAMMAVGLGAREVMKYLPKDREVYVGCHNSPESVTISGKVEEVDELETILKKGGIFARKVKSSGFANHSPMVEGAAEYFRQHFRKSLPEEDVMSIRKSEVRMYSCITGGKVDAAQLGLDYWAKNISAPVLFDEALQDLLMAETDIDCLIEVGPHSALAGPIRQTKSLLKMDNDRLMYLPTLIRGNDGVDDMLRLAGSLYVAGHPINLQATNAAEAEAREDQQGTCIVDLPGYQWTYDKIHWSQTSRSQALLFRKHTRHDLLGSFDSSSTPDTVLWRNTFALNDLPWLADHKIGSSVLVPASAYIAMAVEAVTQSTIEAEVPPKKFMLKSVVIKSPIRLAGNEPVEVVFELSGRSRAWQSFKVSSVAGEGVFIEHASGFIKSEVREDIADAVWVHSDGPSSPSGGTDIYAKFQQRGLSYGPCFRTLHGVKQYEGNRARAQIEMCSTQNTMELQSRYIIHPATMDGCFQLALAAILSEDHGIKRSYLPSSIPEMTIVSHQDLRSADHGNVKCRARMCGLRSIEANFDLSHGGFLQLQGRIELVAVEGLIDAGDDEIMPEPYQRVVWQPDIDLLRGDWSFAEWTRLGGTEPTWSSSRKAPGHANSSVLGRNPGANSHSTSQSIGRTLECLKKILRMLLFKRPGVSILEIGGSADTRQSILQAAGGDCRYPTARCFTSFGKSGEVECHFGNGREVTGNIDSEKVDWDQSFEDQGVLPGSINVLIVSALPDSYSLRMLLQKAQTALSRHFRLIIHGESFTALYKGPLQDQLMEEGLTLQTIIPEAQVGLACMDEHVIAPSKVVDAPTLWILHERDGEIPRQYQALARDAAIRTKTIPFSEVVELPKAAKVLVLVEVEKPMVSSIDAPQMQQLQVLFKRASAITWVTGGRDPRMALMRGMMKSLRFETPGLDLRTIHVDAETCDMNQAATLVLETVKYGHTQSQSEELSTVIQDGRIWICRYTIDEDRNMLDLARSRGIITKARFEEGLQLDFRRIGYLDTFFFRQVSTHHPLGPGCVRVKPLGFALSRQNAMVLKGTSFGHFFSHESFGVVEEVRDESEVCLGDVVICLAGSMIKSELTVPETSCLPCTSEEEAMQLIGFVEPLYLAYMMLAEIVRLRRDDKVSVKCPDPVLRQAMAMVIDNFEGHLEDAGNEQRIHERSIDAIVDAEGDLNFERYRPALTLGARLFRLTFDGGRPASSVGIHGSFEALGITIIDAQDMLQVEPGQRRKVFDAIKKLLPTMVSHRCHPESISDHENRRAQTNSAVDSTSSANANSKVQVGQRIFDLNRISEAVKCGLDDERADRIVLRCGRNTMVPIHRIMKSKLRFSDDGSYLLVGCLGGLGRSLTKWMKVHGARHFVFLSRSGTDKPEAKSLIEDLQKEPDVTVKVIRGNVCCREDVERAVKESSRVIRGVVQAAVVYNECRFENMTPGAFHAVLRPKVVGTMNLHQATLQEPLDFFVMLSSSIELMGATTQTHYTAANAFLDAMARYRRQIGLAAVSLSLGMITGLGRFREETGLSKILQKRGAYAITEAEFLRMMEVACCSGAKSKSAGSADVVDVAVVVTAVDPTKFLNTSANGGIPEWWLNDARFRHVAQAVKTLDPHSILESASQDEAIAKVRAKVGMPETRVSDIISPVQICVLKKLSTLVLIPVEKLEQSLRRPLSELGMDSIVGTELQSWLWRELKVALDFMELFASQMSMASLVEIVAFRLLDGRGSEEPMMVSQRS